MRTHRRGLTVIELVLILVVLGVVVFFLLRLRGSDDAAAPAGAALASDSAVATPAAAAGLATRLALATPVDSTARAGDTVTVRVRATNEGGTGVVGTALRFSAEGGGSVEPATATANDLGVAEARWVLGDGPQTLRASIDGGAAEPLVVTLPATAGATPR